MTRRIAILALLILVMAPALYACEECTDGVHCITGLQTGWFCQFFPRGGCINDGFCPDGGLLQFQAEWRVAAVRVIEPGGKPLPKAQPQREPAPVRTAAK